MSQPSSSSSSTPPLLALISDPSRSKLIKQGAEAKAYRVEPFWPAPKITLGSGGTSSLSPSSSPSDDDDAALFSRPLLLKHRFPKTYRHPLLSSHLTLSRTQSEARVLVRCLRKGVSVPRLACLDERQGIVAMEWIEGRSVRELLGGGAEGEEERVLEEEEEEASEGGKLELDEQSQLHLMRLVGEQLAKMHHADVIHGDLTTSNMMLRRASDKGKSRASPDDVARPLEEGDEVVLIDFGLSSTSSLAEDKAVDLYVLERAFASTHPSSEALFSKVLSTYAQLVQRLWEESKRLAESRTGSREEEMQAVKGVEGKTGGATGKRGKGDKGAPGVASRDPWLETEKKLKEVRLRGRKRDMTG